MSLSTIISGRTGLTDSFNSPLDLSAIPLRTIGIDQAQDRKAATS